MMPASFTVFVRDHVWRVQAATPVADRLFLDLIDSESGDNLQVLSPPEKVLELADPATVFSKRTPEPQPLGILLVLPS
jgi:hypothetical protein